MYSTHLLCMLCRADNSDPLSQAPHYNTSKPCLHVLDSPAVHALQTDQNDMCSSHLLCMLCRLTRTTSSSKRCSSTCGATCTAQAPPQSCGQLWPRCQANPSSSGCSPGPIKGASPSYKWGGRATLSQSHRHALSSLQLLHHQSAPISQAVHAHHNIPVRL